MFKWGTKCIYVAAAVYNGSKYNIENAQNFVASAPNPLSNYHICVVV